MKKQLTKQAEQVVQKVLRDITHSPGGYAYWQQLPPVSYYSARTMQKRWTTWIKGCILPPQLHRAAVLACLTADGVPDSRGKELYSYLLEYVYNGKQSALYADWVKYTNTDKPSTKVQQHHQAIAKD